MRFLSVCEVAKEWGVSERSVRNYCAAGRVPGAFLTGKTWNIPEHAEKPERVNKKEEPGELPGDHPGGECGCGEPKLLFKYRSVKTTEELVRLIRILEDKKIYFPSVQELNDSLEGTGTALLSLGEGIYESNMRKAYHVLSFTENCFSPVMWSHYGGDRSGVCIGFYKGSSRDEENRNFLKIARKINYVESRNMFSAEEDTAIKSDLFYKHKDWSYEREWRIIAKDGNEAIVPDEEGFPYFQFESSDVACLILGEKMDEMLKRAIVKLVPGIPIYTIACEFQTYDYSVKNNETGENIYSTAALYEDLTSRK